MENKTKEIKKEKIIDTIIEIITDEKDRNGKMNNQEKRRLETPNKKQNSLDNLNDGFEGFRKEDEDKKVVGIVDNLNNERVATLFKTHKHKWKKMCRDEERNRDIYQCQLCTRIKCVDLKTGDKFILQEKYEI